jgi:hypothetical protein
VTSRRGEEVALTEAALTFESFSGPMFQRPGTTLYAATDLQPDVDRLYGHLSVTQRRSLVTRLVAVDRRSASVAATQGTFEQQGQRAYSIVRLTQTFDDPRSASEANSLYGPTFRPEFFRATAVTPLHTATQGTNPVLQVDVTGRVSEPGRPVREGVRKVVTYPVTTRPSDATVLASSRPTLPNPGRYAWRVARSHATTGISTIKVFAERVLAYLHHGTLDASATDHFTRPESDANFFATSTFAPPPPPGSSGAAGASGSAKASGGTPARTGGPRP